MARRVLRLPAFLPSLLVGVILAGANHPAGAAESAAAKKVDAAIDKAVEYLFSRQQQRMRILSGRDGTLATDLDAEWKDLTITKSPPTVKAKGQTVTDVVAVLPAGWFDPEPDSGLKPDATQIGARSALATLALLQAGVNPNNNKRMAKAVECLAYMYATRPNKTGAAELLWGPAATRAVGLRNAALEAALRVLRNGDLRTAVAAALSADGRRLAEGYVAGGGYGPGLQIANAGGTFNLADTEYGVLGLWSTGGADPGDRHWKALTNHVTDLSVREGGGFAPNGNLTAEPGASIDGLAVLSMLTETAVARGKGGGRPEPAPLSGDPAFTRVASAMDKTLDYLSKSATGARDAHDLWSAALAGLIGGHKRFGTYDWYADNLPITLGAQQPAGQWELPKDPKDKDGRASALRDPVTQTALRLFFLSAGATPVFVNKLRWGKPDDIQSWQYYPRDAAALAAWHQRQYGAPARWQIVTLSEGREDDLQDAPFLYVSGSTEPTFTDAEVGILRRYVRRGGTILFVACGPGKQGAPFVEGVQRLAKAIFPAEAYPELQFAPMPKDHPIFKLAGEEAAAGMTRLPLQHIHNGSRSLMILCTEDIAAAWAAGPPTKGKPREAFQLAANLRAYCTDRAPSLQRLRGLGAADQPAPVATRGTVKVGVVKYKSLGTAPAAPADGGEARVVETKGDWDSAPEWTNYARWLVANAGMEIEETRGVSLTAPELKSFDVLHLAGHYAFELSQPEKKALQTYIQGGGSLIIDSPGGTGAEFQRTAAAVLRELFPNALRPLAEGHPLLSGAGGTAEVSELEFSRAVRLSRAEPPGPEDAFSVLTLKGRTAVLVCSMDLSLALAGQPCWERLGPTTGSARRLTANFLSGTRAGRGK